VASAPEGPVSTSKEWGSSRLSPMFVPRSIQAFAAHPFAQIAKGWGTHSNGGAVEIKVWATNRDK